MQSPAALLSPHRFAPAAVLGLALIILGAATPVAAAKIYRCGNVFQDQPCPDVKIAAVTAADRPLEAPRATTRETPCATRDAAGRNDCVAKAAPTRDVAGDARR